MTRPDTRSAGEAGELNVIASLSALLIEALMLWSVWGRGVQMGAIALGAGLMSAFHFALVPRVATRHPIGAEWLRVAVSVLWLGLLGEVVGWENPTIWLWGPFFAVVSDASHRGLARSSVLLHVGVPTFIALASGCPPLYPVLFAALAAICFAITEKRVRHVSALLDAREHANRELALAHAQLEHAQEAAVAQEKLSSLGLLAAGIAHEINNPMGYVTSNLQTLMSELSDLPTSTELLREYQDEILPDTLDGVRRVNAIVADLRRFARGDPESMVAFDLNSELRAAARIVHGRFPAGTTFRTELRELPPIMGLPRQLSQVAVNLVVNAAQAIGPHGSVCLRSGADARGVWFAVEDDGPGMDEETQRHLFHPFFTTKPLGEGTGLGLSVVHGIVQAHGGTVKVASAPGRGTCFTVFLHTAPAARIAA